MRICIPNPLFHPFKGGIENHVRAIGKRLSRNHQVQIITGRLPGTESFSVVDGMEVYRLPSRFLAVYSPPASFTRGVREKIAELKPDVIHLHNRWSPEYARAAASFLGRIPLVLTWHNDYGEGVGWQRPLSQLNDWRFMSRIAVRSTATICISKYVKGRLLRRGMREEALQVIYNGVEAKKPSDHEEDFILYVGRLVGTKGLDVLAKAMERIDVKLLACGEGPLSKTLQGVPNVELLGHVDEETKNDLLRRCKFLVLPSRMESFGLVLLEAMAVGKPVVATRVGGMPEVVGDGGILVDPGDAADLAGAMNEMLSDPSLRRKLGRKAWRRARLLSWDKAASSVERVYEQAISQH